MPLPKAQQRFYLKSFFIFGFPFAVIMSIFFILESGKFEFWMFLFEMIFFGGFISWFAVSDHIRRIKSLGYDVGLSKNLSVHQERIIETRFPPDEIMALYGSNADFSKIKYDPESETVKFVYRNQQNYVLVSVAFHLLEERGDSYIYRVKVRPFYRSILFDTGASLMSIQYMEDYIRQKEKV
jgi:hypothetical protein